MRKCQFCAEDIQDEAVVCKHCGRDLLAILGPPALPPGVGAVATVDSRMAAEEAEYAKRGYKVSSLTLGSVSMERAATKIGWGWMIGLFLVTGVGWLFYLLIWGIWGVHKSYRVILSQGPDGVIREDGDVLTVFDQDRVRVHGNRLRVGGWLLIAVGILMAVGTIGSAVDPSTRGDTSLAWSLLVGLPLIGVLPAFIGFVLLRASRKVGLALDAGSASAPAAAAIPPAPRIRSAS